MMISILCYILYGAVGVVVFTLALGWWMNGYFRRRGVKSPPAYLPFIGNAWTVLSRKVHYKDYDVQMFKEYPDERYIGLTQFATPILMIMDIDLIKQITIKDFDHFIDHFGTLRESGDLLFGRGLFGLGGQKWRDMRATMSPAFTSSKMRGMFQFIVDCGEQMTNYYIKEMDKEENKARGLLELDMKDVFSRYANDVIATCAFGLRVNSFADTKNQFYLMGKEATDFSGLKLYKFTFMMFLPKLSKMLGIKFLSEKVSNFFRNLVWDTIKDREEHNTVRNDMIQLLMEAKKGTLRHDSQEDGKEAGFATVEESSVGKGMVKTEWEDDDIVGQAVSFFAAGFDTTSSLVAFIIHELALHPEIHRKLQEEIDAMNSNIDGKLTYDCLHKMKYMDMVVSETLRMWPPALESDRICVKSYTLPPPNAKNSKGLELEPGIGLVIPIYAIHHSPKYFKNPEVFDPERFSDENKHNILPGTYIPFGIGPRNCIGSRFALMEIKAVIYNLLLKFDVLSTAKTQNPIKLKIDTFSLHAEHGNWVGLKPRYK